MKPVTTHLYTWVKRDKVKQRDGRGLNPGPPDPVVRGINRSATHASCTLYADLEINLNNVNIF